MDKNLLIRRVNLSANNVLGKRSIKEKEKAKQLSLFIDYKGVEKKKEKGEIELLRERKIQETILNIKEKYGKNAVIKGTNLEEGATALDRNKQIGGHRA